MRHKVWQSSGNRFGKAMGKGVYPPQSRSPKGIPSFIHVWVVWEENFIELRRRIAVYQFNENGP